MSTDELFDDALNSIYTAASEPARWPDALDSISNCFAAEGTVMFQRHDDGRMAGIVSQRLIPAMVDYEKNWSHRDVRAIRAVELGLAAPEGVFTDLDILSPGDMESEPFYRDFCATHGIWWFCAGNVSPRPNIIVLLSVQRARDKGAFRSDEIKLFLRLARHAESALRLTVRIADTELINASLSEAIDRFGCAVFMLNTDGSLQHANRFGEELLGSVFIVSGNGLLPRDPSSQPAYERLIKEAVSSARLPLRPLLIRCPGKPHPLVCHFIRVNQRHGKLASFGRDQIVVLVTDPNEAGAPDPTMLRDLLNLTLGEARVASIIGTGRSPKEAALTLGTTEETIRTVLKRVFAKSGVSRQAELASLITRLTLGA